MTQWSQCMIDVEAMGKRSDAALVSIGAAFFNLHDYTIGPRFHRPIHLATSVSLGMKMYPDTVIWWLRQSDEARRAISYNLLPIADVLDEFRAWLNAHGRKQDVRTWGNSARFDMGILDTAYHLKDGYEQEPWAWNLETCFRTVRNMNAHVEYDPTQRTSTHHNAADDAVFQIEHLFKIRRFNLEHRPLRLPK